MYQLRTNECMLQVSLSSKEAHSKHIMIQFGWIINDFQRVHTTSAASSFSIYFELLHVILCVAYEVVIQKT